jgi:hypothetical protein
MHGIPRKKLSARDARSLGEFLSSGDRPERTLNLNELRGFLFAIACSPELIRPSEWLPLVSNDRPLRPGCEFRDKTSAKLNEQAPLSQRSRGFTLGHDWLREVWDERVPDDLSERSQELAACMMVLSFFSSRAVAEAFHRESNAGRRRAERKSFREFADIMRELFPSALMSYAS